MRNEEGSDVGSSWVTCPLYAGCFRPTIPDHAPSSLQGATERHKALTLRKTWIGISSFFPSPSQPPWTVPTNLRSYCKKVCSCAHQCNLSRTCLRQAGAKSRATGLQPQYCNVQSAISNQQSAISNPQSAIRNPQSAIRNPQSAIRNPQSAIRNPQSAKSLPSSQIFPDQAKRFMRWPVSSFPFRTYMIN